MRACLLMMLLSLGCSSSSRSPGPLVGQYDLQVITPPFWLFTASSMTDGRMDVLDQDARGFSGTIAFGRSSWNQPRCLSVPAPADCKPDHSASDSRHGTFYALLGSSGCIVAEIQTNAGAMHWQGFLDRDDAGKPVLNFGVGAAHPECHGAAGGFAYGWPVAIANQR